MDENRIPQENEQNSEEELQGQSTSSQDELGSTDAVTEKMETESGEPQNLPTPTLGDSGSGYIPSQEGTVSELGEVSLKKGINKGMAALFIVIAVLILALVALFVSRMFWGKPVDVVTKALEVTEEAILAKNEQFNNEIPLGRLLQKRLLSDGEIEPQKSQFSVSIVNFDTGSGSIEEQMISGLLQSFSIDGTFLSVPKEKFTELDTSLNLAGNPLVSLFTQSTPEQLAFSLPTFSSRTLAVYPDTFLEDLKGSPLFGLMGMPEETMAEMQRMLEAGSGTMNGIFQLDYMQLQQDIQEIMKEGLVNAQYASPRKENGVRLYDVTLDGLQVKKTIGDILQYTYVDSQIAELYNEMFGAELFGGRLFSELMTEEILVPFNEKVTEVPTTITFAINGKKQIVAVDTAMQMVGDIDMEVKSRYTLDDALNISMDMNMLDNTDGKSMSTDLNVKQLYENGRQDVIMTMTTKNPSGGMGAQEMDMDMTFGMDKEGGIYFNMAMEQNIEYVGPVKMEFDVEGSVTQVDNRWIYDFPKLKGSIINEGTASLTFQAKMETEPLAEPYPGIVSDAEPLLKLNALELSGLMQEYSDGANQLMDKLLGTIMDSSLGGIPEEAAPAV